METAMFVDKTSAAAKSEAALLFQHFMFGSTGNDTYIVTDPRDVIIEDFFLGDSSFGDIDTVMSFVPSYTLPAGVENLFLKGTAITGNGNELANLIEGNDQANFIHGWGQDDRLFGNDGNDWISGDDGNDLIAGGKGRDDLMGGVGKDTFVWAFTSESGVSVNLMDKIWDFNPLEGDKIDLRAIDANETWTGPGNEDFTFVTTNHFTAPGQVRCDFDTSTGDLLIWLNTDGNLNDAEMGIIVPFIGFMPDANWFLGVM